MKKLLAVIVFTMVVLVAASVSWGRPGARSESVTWEGVTWEGFATVTWQ